MTLFSIILATALSGFAYGHQAAPTGNEWQNPQALSLNKEQPHAWFFSFQDKEHARKILPENSSLWKSLDGDWKFNWVGNPEQRPVDFYKTDFNDSSWDVIPVPSSWNVVGIGKDGSQKYGTPVYVNQPVVWYHENRTVGDWKLGVMRTPPETWTTYKNRNEVGSYRRTFEVPADWNGDEVFINFDGVDSFFYLWINGSYVGFSKNSRNVAQFNITPYIRKGQNLVAVEVYRFSDGSNLEVQDMFRLPGIFRSVALEAKPKAHVRNIKVTPSLNSLKVEAEVVGENNSTIDWSLYENKLYSDENSLVAVYPDMESDCELKYGDAKPWSAEEPNMYVLVGELKDSAGHVVDVFSTGVGFREVEIRNKFFYLNGETFKMRGVNRHETEPSLGHAITRELMEQDVMMMKRANINHVRDSHYPDAPYWYYLCDRYGIYLMDEANNECHMYGYGDASLTHVPEFRDAFVARMVEMVTQNYNHPSIVVWSSGNECGPGINFHYVYEAAKAIDPMRPVQYERNNGDGYSDFGCSQYPSVDGVRKIASGKADKKYPYHINEFAHSMGNSLGDFADYWAAIDSTNYICGACIWDWVDQSLYNYTKNGTRYLCSGGEFGDYPNDGQFVMNGILFGDRTPKPQYYEVKKVYQPLYCTLDGDKLDLFNRNYFKAASYMATWKVTADGKELASGKFNTGEIKPGQHLEMDLPAISLPEGKECFMNISFCNTEDTPWAPKGYECSREQVVLQKGTAAIAQSGKGKVNVGKTANGLTTLTGKHFKVVFNNSKGTIQSLTYGKESVIVPGCGPVLNLFRAPVNNDGYAARDWFANGLFQLQHKASGMEVRKLSDGSVEISYTVESKAVNGAKLKNGLAACTNEIIQQPENTDVAVFPTHETWTVSPDGSITLKSTVESSKPDLIPAKIGYVMQLPESMDSFSWYGRGPRENYPDRYTDSFIGQYSSTVKEQYVDYTKPQDNGNHEQVRWAELRDASGVGIRVTPVANTWHTSVSGAPVMSVSALPWSAMEMFIAQHSYLLPKPTGTWLCIDAAMLGLGGQSCGPRPQNKNIYYASGTFGFKIEPVPAK